MKVKFPEKEKDFNSDWQWKSMYNPWPGVVLEVGYTQTRDDLEQKTKDYIHWSSGEINSVLIIDIEYIAPKRPSLHHL